MELKGRKVVEILEDEKEIEQTETKIEEEQMETKVEFYFLIYNILLIYFDLHL